MSVKTVIMDVKGFVQTQKEGMTVGALVEECGLLVTELVKVPSTLYRMC